MPGRASVPPPSTVPQGKTMRIVLLAALLFGASQVAAQPYAYVSNSISNDVDVIDNVTQTVVLLLYILVNLQHQLHLRLRLL